MQCKIYWELDVQNGPVREWSLSTENRELKTLHANNINTAVTRIQDGFEQGAQGIIIDARNI